MIATLSLFYSLIIFNPAHANLFAGRHLIAQKPDRVVYLHP